jgi:hypothetical protein
LVIYSVVVDDAQGISTGVQVVCRVEVNVLTLDWVLTDFAVEYVA